MSVGDKCFIRRLRQASAVLMGLASATAAFAETTEPRWKKNPLAAGLYFPDYHEKDEPPPAAHGECPTAPTQGFTAMNHDADGVPVRYYARFAPAARATLVFFHGNAGTACGYTTFFGKDSAAFGSMNVVLAEFPGYGGDSSEINQGSMTDSANALVKYLQNQVRLPLVVWGYSLGSGIAVNAASRNDVAGLIVTAPYDSIINVARQHKPFLFPIIALVGRSHAYPAAKWAAAVKAPVLAIYSSGDKVIPAKRSEKLIHALSSDEIRVEKASNLDHSKVFSKNPGAVQAAVEFVSRVISR